MDAYDIADKIKKYWAALYPKNSGQIRKEDKRIRVIINTHDGYREVVGVKITDKNIELLLDNE